MQTLRTVGALSTAILLYGTTNSGGTYSEYCEVGCGTVFSLTP
jgi:hypothetical protein